MTSAAATDDDTRTDARRRGADGRLIVTIDGPAGTGKSSVARELALRLGLELLDTGAMYRAAAALALDAGLTATPADEPRIAALVRRADLHFDWDADPPALVAGGRRLAARLRDADVTAAVSPVSGLPEVRRVLVDLQRRIGEAHPRLVSEGRDQGSVVFFDADVKIYLDAAPRVRAERRADQLAASGRAADVDLIEAELRERDARDAGREVGPLRCPDGAHVVDTSELDRRAVVDRLEAIVRAGVSDPPPALGPGSGGA